MTSPERANWNTIWLGTLATAIADGWYPVMADVRVGKTAVFDRRLTIGPADLDSDDLISTLSIADWSGGGQIEEMSGADQSRYWWGIFDGRSPRQAALPPLVNQYRPNSNCTKCWPLGVTGDKALFCFLESGTPEVWFFNESTLAFDYNGGAGVSITSEPVGKAIEFAGSVFVPCGANGYKIIVDGGSGVPSVTSVAGAADPTAPGTLWAMSSPRPVAFAVFDSLLYALTATGRIAKSKTGANNEWQWQWHDATQRFPAIESGSSPKRLIPFFNRSGTETLVVTTDKGALMFDESVPAFKQTPIQFPAHPDISAAAAVFRPGEDLWIATGLDTVHYTAANVVVPLSGISRDAGVPVDYRGKIVDLEPELSCLYALISPYTTAAAWEYSAQVETINAVTVDDPRGLAVDSNGKVWACDENNERVVKLTSALVYDSVTIGTAGSGDGQFASNNGPYDVAVDSSNNLFVVDRGNHRVQKFNNAGTYQSEIGAAGYEYSAQVGVAGGTGADNNFDDARDLVVLSDNTLVVCDENNERIKKYSNALVFSAKTGTAGMGNGQFATDNGPWGIDRDSSDNLYVTDRGNHRVQKFNSSLVFQSVLISGTDWSVQGTFGPTFNSLAVSDPRQIATNSIGEIYICDNGNARLVILNADGTYEDAITGLTNIKGVALDSSDNVYVISDTRSLRKYNSGLVLQYGPITFGTGTLEELCTDNTYLYIVDSGNRRIWKRLASDGSAVTNWGTAGTGDGQFTVPSGICVTGSEVYVGDAATADRIQVFNTSGTYQRQWSLAANPMHLVADDSGDIWVTHFEDQARRYSNTGTLQVTITTTDPSGIARATGDILWIANSTDGTITKWDESNVCDSPEAIAVNRTTGRIYTSHATSVKYWTSAGVFEGGWGPSYNAGANTLGSINDICVDQSSGSVYVVDNTNDKIIAFSATGGYQSQFTHTGSPRYLAIHPTTGNVYVGDDGADTVTEYTTAGTLVRTFGSNGTGNGEFQFVTGLGFDSSGNFFAADSSVERVQKFTKTTPVSGTSTGEFSSPEAIDIKRSSGRIYVLDVGNSRVQYFTSSGTYEGQWGSVGTGDGQFTTPTDLAVDQTTGQVYVVDSGNDRIQRFDATGTFLGKWGSSGSNDGQFITATSIAIDPDNSNVFVADIVRDDVQEFTSSGGFARKFGSSGTGNGQFTTVSGMALDQAGDILYIADDGDDRIQKFVPGDDAGSKPYVTAWTGTGWHGVWEGTTGAAPTFLEVMNVTNGYRAWWGLNDGYAYTAKLRRSLHNPRTGVLAVSDEFAASGYVETSNADMGMLGFTKIASHVIVFMRAASSTELIRVYYNIDDAGYNLLGTVTAAGKTVLPMTAQTMTLDTGATTTVYPGLPFNWIRFKLELARGSTTTVSPLIRAFNLHFLKVPQNSSTFQFSVYLPKRKWNGRSAAEIAQGLDTLIESQEMVFLRHHDQLYRGRVSQITGTDVTGEDHSGILNVNFVEVQSGV